MKNKRANRRFQTARVQARRARDASWLGIPLNERSLGRLKKSHFGCGCKLCKPWKWGEGEDRPHSEKKKLMGNGS